MSVMPTKNCIACGEAINQAAKRCPHCHFHQDKVLLYLSSSWSVAILVLAGVAFLLYNSLREPVLWSVESSAVGISELSVRATDRRDSTDLACSGLLKSGSKHEWSDFVVEATFQAADGQIIDTITQRLREPRLAANGEARVRVLDRGAWLAAEYKSCKLVIRSATPG